MRRTLADRVARILDGIKESTQDNAEIDCVADALDRSRDSLFACFRERTGLACVAQALTLKVLNLCLARYEFLTRRTNVVSRPFGVLVDPANGCHLACPGCVHSRTVRQKGVFDWKGGMVSEAAISEILRQFGPYAIQVLFNNYGEPLLNPETPRYVRLAKKYLAQTVLSTSLAMPRFDAEAYVRCGLDHMIVSIDGATQAVYERFRRGGQIGVVFENVDKLVSARRKAGVQTPVVCWQYLAFEHNVHEIHEAIYIAHSLGVDEFKITAPFDVTWDDPEIRAATIKPRTIAFHRGAPSSYADNWNPFPGEIDRWTIEREFARSWRDRVDRRSGASE